MTSNAARAAVLMRALFASIHHDRGAAVDIYTDDVRAWTPAISTSSLAELMAEFDRRDDAFSDIELDVAPLEVGGDYACAEWSVTMTQTGQLAVDRGRIVKPTGVRVTLNGITVAEFRGDRICSLRQYWDELTVFDQLGLLHGDDEPLARSGRTLPVHRRTERRTQAPSAWHQIRRYVLPPARVASGIESHSALRTRPSRHPVSMAIDGSSDLGDVQSSARSYRRSVRKPLSASARSTPSRTSR